ncbi:MAG: hypothetical protein EOP84_08800 [Verrucomicrobiaceae bacterium]|nr:MAG: hypothetical protein EOP84_08800 [Verrucomicrobiaceae bacterium]
MKLTHENLQGSWIVAGSEIEHVGPGDEIYHFTPPDRFVMEFKQSNGRRYPRKQRYALTEEGFVFGPEGNLRFAVTAWLESGFLIFRPVHGMETWSTRMTDEESQAEQDVSPQPAARSKSDFSGSLPPST